MAKLFITLYLVVLGSFVLFIASGNVIEYVGNSMGANADIEKRVSKGTFILLGESIQGLDQKTRDDIISQHRNVFGPVFKLVEIDSIPIEKTERDKIKQGNIFYEEDFPLQVINNNSSSQQDKEYDVLYRKLANTTLAWQLDLDIEVDLDISDNSITLSVTGGKFVKGMFYLLKQKLQQNDPQSWQAALQKLQPNYGLPLSLLKENELKIYDSESKSKILAELNTGKAINISQGSISATFVQKLEEDIYLQIGPIEIPWYMRNFLYVFLAAFALSIATALFLWVWPLWSSLVKIKKAADEFGAGNYNARIPYRKRSSIAKVSQAFNKMAERTQRSIQAQKELTSAVSHELRTPVARMKFALEMLEASKDQASRKRFANNINEDIDELNLLLEELLSYARFDEKDTKITPRIEKIIPWLSNSMEKLMPLAENKTLNYQVEGIGVNETTLFEPRLMSRVLDNLVQNALRYAHQNVEVTLTKDNQFYLLIVKDDGDGIPESKRDQVFDAFSRIDASRDRASGGFGLGLAIVDRIIQAHKGDITLHESDLGGASFEVRWPVDIDAD